ncbi:hypothetical protein [Pseudobacteriovorax antillogorgiicola]|nr:hypothetical protein [Pseudobacteriovorax antillogorgiicola]
MESVIKHVFEGTADGAYLNVEVARYVMKKSFADRMPLVFNPRMLHDKGGYLVSTTKHPSLINDLNQFLKSSDIRNQVLEKFGVAKQF